MSKMKELYQMKMEGKCPFCGVNMSDATFKDEKSLKEYEISGLCQKCQDKFFKGGG